jgi:hypothetical protein
MLWQAVSVTVGFLVMTGLVWVLVGAGVLGVIGLVLGRSRERSSPPEMGTVSAQWIAEHRNQADGSADR